MTQTGNQPVLPELTPELRRLTEPPKPSQFQRFVQESTGKLLPIYGTELFSQVQTYTPVTNIAPPANYMLGPGDEVQLQVWGAIDLATKLVVDSKGQITIPAGIRHRLHLQPGDVLDFDETSPFLKATKSIAPEAWEAFGKAALDPWAGIDIHQILDELRGPVELPATTKC